MARRLPRLALAALLVALSLPRAAAAQQTGQIAGRVVDAAGRPLPAARVAVQGTTLAAVANVDGRYSLARVPAGEHTLTVSLLSYAPKTVTGVRVAAGGVTAQDVSLTAQGIALGAVTATATRERGSVNRALDEQRTATGIVNATTSEQIARSPDADAAQAVQRVSGVTVQDGRYVFVRGLGERYTTASLNGARLPSPEPEKKVVPLDLFPSALLESISTSKTFTPDQPGDFSGASVNLKTRSFPLRRTAQLSLGTGYVTGAGASLPRPGGTGWLGDRAAARDLPPLVRNAGGFGGLQQGDLNRLVRSFRNDWSPGDGGLPPNLTGSLTLGGQQGVLGQKIGYIGAFSYGRSQEARLGEQRALGVAGADNHATAENEFHGVTATEGVLWGGMMNFTTFLGTGTRLELNNSYNRSADSEAHTDRGSLLGFENVQDLTRTQLRYVERSVRSSQLRGTHTLFGDAQVDWSLSDSRVTRDEPDRSEILYGSVQNPVSGGLYPYGWLSYVPSGARRSFLNLDETSREAQGGLTLNVGPASADARIKLGGAYRRTARDADSRAYNIYGISLTPDERALTPEQIFDGRYTADGDAKITVQPNTAGGFYQARDRVAAGYLMGEWTFAGRFRVIGGARVERWMLDLLAEPTQGSAVPIERRNTDVLPSLALNVELGDAQNLRFSASRTLARPEYRELAPVQYTSLAGEEAEFGNAGLVRTRVQNYDARWELYPSAGEVVSFGLFAKRFQDPIERIEVAATGANLVSFANAQSAVNYGAELELRKGLGAFAERLEPFSVFTNLTVMRSDIRTGNDTLSAATRDNRPMVGQAPYVLNAGLSYSSGDASGTSATLLYNVVGRRIWAAAQVPLVDDAYELPRQVLDLSLRTPLPHGMSARFDAKNLLDSPVQVRQGDVTRLRYRTGRSIGIGVSWKP